MRNFGITFADFFSNNVNNRGDYLYGTVHIIWLVFTVLLCALMSLLLRKNKHAGKIIAGFCLLLILEQLFARGRNIYFAFRQGMGFWPAMSNGLPFHICAVNGVLLGLTFFFNIKPLKEFVFMTSLGGGLVTILYPESMIYDTVLRFTILDSMFVHTMLIFIPVFLFASGVYRPDVRKSWQVLIGTLCCIGWAELGNRMKLRQTGKLANFMYLHQDPMGLPLPFHHMFVYAAIFVILMTLLYIPSIAAYAKKKGKDGDKHETHKYRSKNKWL